MGRRGCSKGVGSHRLDLATENIAKFMAERCVTGEYLATWHSLEREVDATRCWFIREVSYRAMHGVSPQIG
jgi:hypothetical protein